MQTPVSRAIATELAHSAAPIARFLGHSLAASLGFILLGAISLIPLGAVKLLSILGVDHLNFLFGAIEKWILYADIAFFSVIFLLGAIELLAVEVVAKLRSIKSAYQSGK